ncbi:hypothetical protein [Dinoroseobacter sp. S76]|uniref:hypothetical protein n=1 Tax=Dinoroseobacter sp. S76 TaxID=3415124 RepID=UPI003C7CEB51
MDALISETVAALHTLPEDAKRQIALDLLHGGAPLDLPVIEFTDPTLDRADAASDTLPA